MNPDNSMLEPNLPTVIGADTASPKHKKLLAGAIVVVTLLVVTGILVVLSKTGHKANNVVNSSSSKAVKKPVKTTLNAKIVTDYGYSVTVSQLVTGFVAKHPQTGIEPIIITLSVAEVSRAKYDALSPRSSDFVIVVDGKEIKASQYYSGVTDYDLSQSFYTKLSDATPTTGRSQSGSLLFGIPKNTKPTALRLKQKEARTLSPQSILPAKNYDLPL